MGTAIGILATATYIPNQKIKAGSIAEASGLPQNMVTDKLGILEKPIADQNEDVAYMAVQASQKAIRRAEISAEDIDLIISISSEYKAYPFQNTALKIQQQIGNSNAWGIDLSQQSCTLIAALHIAKRMMQSDPTLKNVLIAGGCRDHDKVNLHDPQSLFLYAFAAAGAAVILRRNHTRNLLWGGHLVSDSQYIDMVYQTRGGSRTSKEQDHETDDEYIHVHHPHFFDTSMRMNFRQKLQHVIEHALDCSEELQPISYLALMHVPRSMHVRMLKTLGLRLDQSYYLERYGQMGALDPIVSLELGIQAKRVKAGDVIVMASAGIGYTWGAQVIRWG